MALMDLQEYIFLKFWVQYATFWHQWKWKTFGYDNSGVKLNARIAAPTVNGCVLPSYKLINKRIKQFVENKTLYSPDGGVCVNDLARVVHLGARWKEILQLMGAGTKPLYIVWAKFLEAIVVIYSTNYTTAMHSETRQNKLQQLVMKVRVRQRW